jgi:Tol biopolymer transport system component
MRALGLGCALIGALALLPGAGGAQGSVAPLPDAYLLTTYNTVVNVTKPGAEVETVEIVDGRGRLVRRFDQGSGGLGQARFSPNGKMVAWIDSRGVNVANTDGTGRRLLVAASARCTQVCIGMSYAWAPDGSTIAVGGAGVQTGELLTVNVQTGVESRIAPVVRSRNYAVIGYSPDGSRLAVDIESGVAGTASCCKSLLVVEHPDGTAKRLLFSFFDPIHDGPGNATWSPDGSKLAFTDDGMDIRDPPFAIIDVATATVHAIKGLNTTDARSVWAPDSSALAVVTFTVRPLRYSVDVVDAASGAARRIGLGDQPAAWYEDGTILAAGGKNGNILYALGSNGGRQQPLFTLPKPLQFLSIDPAPAP